MRSDPEFEDADRHGVHRLAGVIVVARRISVVEVAGRKPWVGYVLGLDVRAAPADESQSE